MLFKILITFGLLLTGTFQEDEIGMNCTLQVVCLCNKASFLSWAFHSLDLSLTKRARMDPWKGK